MRIDCLRRDLGEPDVVVLQPVDHVVGETNEGVHALVHFEIPTGGNPDVRIRKFVAGTHDATPFRGPRLIEIGLDSDADCVDSHTDMERANTNHSVAACTPTPWTGICNRDVIKVLMADRASVHYEGNVPATGSAFVPSARAVARSEASWHAWRWAR